MSRLYNTFEFIGNINIPRDKEKFHEVRTSVSGWEGHRLKFAMKESKTNSVFLEMYGGFSKGKPNKVFSFSKGTENEKGTKLEIPWDDRLNPETIDMVADFKKIVVDFTTDPEVKEEINKLRYEIRNIEYKDVMTEEDNTKLKELKEKLSEVAVDRKEFIHEYDAVIYLSSMLSDYSDKKFRVKGSVELNEGKGKFYRKFKPEFFEIVDSDERSKFSATMDIFFTKDSLDEADFKKEKKIYVDGYLLSYDSKAKKDLFFPQRFMINAQKVDFENEKHAGYFNFLVGKFKQKGKGVYHIPWQVNIFRGADQVEFTYKDLTQQQKEAVDFGLNTIEDFAPKGGMLGEAIEENRLVKPLLQEFNKQNDFREGVQESTYEVEDLEFVTTADEKYSDVANKPEEKKEEPQKVDVDLDELFG